MLELSLHVLDIAENSLRAGATTVFITVTEDVAADRLTIEVRDDGAGMSEAACRRALDPFYTTKQAKRVGLGLPLLAQAAEATGGRLLLESEEGRGTKVTVEFMHSHMDRQPFGNMAGTLVTLIAGSEGVDFVYVHQSTGGHLTLDTREIKKTMKDVPISHPEVLQFVRNYIVEGLKQIRAHEVSPQDGTVESAPRIHEE